MSVMTRPYLTQLTQVSPVAVVRFVNGASADQFGSPTVQLAPPERPQARVRYRLRLFGTETSRSDPRRSRDNNSTIDIH
jgi:hypothetical protein